MSFQNTTQILTLWSGERDCYNPLAAHLTNDDLRKADLDKFEKGGWPACCLPAVVEKCGAGWVYNATGAFRTDYKCLKTGCGAGIDGVAIMRLVFQSLYMLVLITAVVIGLGNKTFDVIYETQLVSYFYGAVFYLMGIVYIGYLFNQIDSNAFGIPTAWITSGSFILLSFYGICGLVHGEVHNLMSSWPQYFFLWPSLINICHLLAFSRLDETEPHHSHQHKAAYAQQTLSEHKKVVGFVCMALFVWLCLYDFA